jgi:Rad3-related DNA helicase
MGKSSPPTGQRPFTRPLFLALVASEPGGGDLVRLQAEDHAGNAFDQLLRPANPLTPAQCQRTGLTNQQLDAALDLEDALEALFPFAAEAEVWIVADSAEAGPLLQKAARRCGRAGELEAPFDAPLLGLDQPAALVFPERLRPSLRELAALLNVAPADLPDASPTLIRAVWERLWEAYCELPLPLLGELNALNQDDLSDPLAVMTRCAESRAVQAKFDQAFASGKVSFESLFRDHGELLKRLNRFGGELNDTHDTHDTHDTKESRESKTSKDRTDDAAATATFSPAAVEAGEEAARVLGPEGPLAEKLAGYELRPEQIELARRVAICLTDGRHLLAEAGTGVGKSLAYLTPAVFFAKTTGCPVVISTHTKNLQAQLFRKDLPFLAVALGVPFEAALVKGRSNYLCLRKLFFLLRDDAKMLDQTERSALRPLTAWAVKTETGDIEDAAAFPKETHWELWDRLHASGDDCLNRRCRQYKRCFLFKARALTRDAHVIVANHALLFSELGGEGGALPPYRHVVFDEAHTLENVAVEHLAKELSTRGVRRILQRLFYHAGGDRAGKGLLPALLWHLDASPQGPPGSLAEKIREHALRAIDLIPEAENASTAVFQTADYFLNAGPSPNGGAQRRFSAPALGADEKEMFQQAKEHAVAGLGRLRQALKLILDDCGQSDDDLPEALWATQKDLAAQEKRLSELIGDLEFIMAGEAENYVFWAERTGGNRHPRHGKKGRGFQPGWNSVRWVAAPLDVAGLLHGQLFENTKSSILTSATLSVRDTSAGEKSGLSAPAAFGQAAERFAAARRAAKTPPANCDADAGADDATRPHPKCFEFVKLRLGLSFYGPERLDEILLGSPFDYARQCRLYIPTFLPEPGKRRAGYGWDAESDNERKDDFEACFDEMVAQAVIAAEGRTLALYTSYAALRSAAKRMRPQLAAENIEVLAQGVDGPRELLLERLKENKRTVLLGTASFWEGVDVRGSALSLLIIAKLPFAVFTEPLIEARCDRLEALGKDPFLHYSVPTAILKLRQGFGRLIRSKEDCGVVILADKRVLTKRYGAAFLRALPAVAEPATDSDFLPKVIREFTSNRSAEFRPA